MPRHFDNWLTAYQQYASHSEAPSHMHLWSGVSALAGALRRKVWLDMGYFRWHPNFYILLVAPPGVVSKSTTAGIAGNLLRKVPGIKFGPDSVTWQALVGAFAEAKETFELDGEHHSMCAITLQSSEFGNLVNPYDTFMVNLLIELWDGKTGSFEKKTKHSGNDSLENPFINLVACTTPSWMAGNLPEYMVGEGFTSRCIFAYAEEKAKLVAYPADHIPAGHKDTETKLAEDLEHIALNLKGPYQLTAEAKLWGEAWYEEHYRNCPADMSDDRFGGYRARKQTHAHKLAMILSAAKGDEMVITKSTLQKSVEMVSNTEPGMVKIFSKIGLTSTGVNADRLVQFITKKGKVSYQEAYRYVHQMFPSNRDFEDILLGCIKAGLVKQDISGTNVFLMAGNRN